MASTRNPSARPSPNISTATAKTRSAIHDLQTSLAEASHQPAKSRFTASAIASSIEQFWRARKNWSGNSRPTSPGMSAIVEATLPRSNQISG